MVAGVSSFALRRFIQSKKGSEHGQHDLFLFYLVAKAPSMYIRFTYIHLAGRRDAAPTRVVGWTAWGPSLGCSGQCLLRLSLVYNTRFWKPLATDPRTIGGVPLQGNHLRCLGAPLIQIGIQTLVGDW